MNKKQIPELHKRRLEYLSFLLKETRYSEGLTQKELSRNSNLHRNSIVHAENGRNLTLLSVFELADSLDIRLKDLFQDIE
jgi:DNA-binding XRE family transcriptional regulator